MTTTPQQNKASAAKRKALRQPVREPRYCQCGNQLHPPYSSDGMCCSTCRERYKPEDRVVLRGDEAPLDISDFTRRAV